MIHQRLLFLATAVVVLTGTPALSQDCIEYADYLHWESGFALQRNGFDFAIEGNRLYVLSPDSGVTVIRLLGSHPDAVLGTFATNQSHFDLDVVANLVYLAGPQGLRIYDAGYPPNAHELTLYGLSISALEVRGAMAYAVGPNVGLAVIALPDPAAPEYVGTLPLPSPYDLAVSGTTAYVVTSGPQLTIVDCAVPWAPVVAGQRPLSGNVTDLAIAGELLYVLTQNGGAYVYDIAVATAPVAVAHVPPPAATDHCFAIDAADGFACFTTQSNGLAIIAAPDPQTIHLAGVVPAHVSTEGVVIAGDHTISGSEYYGLDVQSLGSLTPPPMLDSVDLPASAQALTIAEDLAFVALGEPGLAIVRIDDPENLSLLATLDLPGSASGVAIDNLTAWLACGSGGLCAVDVADPAHPSLLSQSAMPGGAVDIVIAGANLVVAGSSSCAVVDGSDPTAPAVLATIPIGASGVDADGGLVFLAGVSSDLTIVDLTSPAQPIVVATLNEPAWFIRDVSVDGSLAILGDSWGYARVVDVTDPAHPVALSDVPLPGMYPQVDVEGELALVGSSDLELLDLQDPLAPRAIGSYHGLDCPVVAADALYAAGGRQLVALPRQCGLGPVAVAVSGFTAADVGQFVRLSWRWSDLESCDFRICASAEVSGSSWFVPWNSTEGREGRAEDTAAAACRPGRIDYQLESRAAGSGSWRVVAETSVALDAEVPGPLRVTARPNPFNPQTTIGFTLPVSSPVDLAIYDVRGRRVATLASGVLTAGAHERTWDGRMESGANLPSGTYLCRLTTDSGTRSAELVLIR